MNGATVIAGIGETPPARRAGKDVRALVVDACLAALDDAGIDPSEVDGIMSDAVVMPPTCSHEYLCAQLGIDRQWDAALSFGGAANAAAPLLAAGAIASGTAKVVLYYFGVDWGTRPAGPYGFHDAYPAKMAYEKPYGFNAQPLYFAFWARRFMHEYGLTTDHLGALAVTQREHALRKGGAQMTRPLTLDDYHASRLIAEPLRVPDCCLVSDGAGAYVMTSAERGRDCRKPPVRVLGTGFSAPHIAGDDVFTQGADFLEVPGARVAARAALDRAGLDLRDVDFAELYDCSTISCLMQIADLGFCDRAEVGDFVASGATRLDGDIPMNTHGGLLSYSYRLGIEHVTEAVRQLRGEAGAVQVPDAQVGLVGGLSNPDYGVLVLGRDG